MRARPVIASLVLLLGIAGRVPAQPAAPTTPPGVKASVVTGSVELTDPAGDVKPIVYRKSVGSGPETEVKYPGFDVVKLAVASNGTTLTFTATLTAPPALAAYEVIEFYVDTDNNAKTGVTLPFAPRLAGLEYYGTLEACIEHEFFGTTCAGTEPQPVPHTAIVTLEKYGKEWQNKDVLLSIPASGTVKEPAKAKVTGAVVQATVPYAAMGVKSGQAIRLIMREACAGSMSGNDGMFPDVVLTLK